MTKEIYALLNYVKSIHLDCTDSKSIPLLSKESKMYLTPGMIGLFVDSILSSKRNNFKIEYHSLGIKRKGISKKNYVKIKEDELKYYISINFYRVLIQNKIKLPDLEMYLDIFGEGFVHKKIALEKLKYISK